MLHFHNNDGFEPIPNEYVINLIWLNQGKFVGYGVRDYDCGKFIYDCQSEQELIDELLNKAKAWQETNPDAKINIWYDSKFLTQKNNVKNTQVLLDKLAQKNPIYKKIKLKDVRDIDIVKNNPDVFSDNLPFYYRLDLLKFIILIHTIKQAALFVDLAVGGLRKNNKKVTETMTKNELFSDEINKRLNVLGIQIGDNENQFIQVVNKPETIKAIKVFINANFSRAITALNLKDEKERIARLCDLSEVVYRTMRNQLFALIVGAIDNENQVKENLLDPNCQEWVKYGPNLDENGCLPLGNYYVRELEEYDTGKIYINGKDYGYSRDKIKLGNIDCKHSYIFGRDDTDTRSGNTHYGLPSELVPNKPADGTKIYKCKYWNTRVEEIQLPTFLPLMQGYKNNSSTQKQNELMINQLHKLNYDNETIQEIKRLNGDYQNILNVAEFLSGCQTEFNHKEENRKEEIKNRYRVLIENMLDDGQQIDLVRRMLCNMRNEEPDGCSIEAIDEILEDFDSKKFVFLS